MPIVGAQRSLWVEVKSTYAWLMSALCHKRTWDAAFRMSSAVLGKLFRRRWHGRGMVVHNEPVVATFHVRKAVARRQALGLSIFNKRKSVVAGVDRRTVVYAN